MDKEEAERLARAIRKAPVAWIQVQAIECKPVTHTYELKCAYRQERKRLFQTQETWTTLCRARCLPLQRRTGKNVGTLCFDQIALVIRSYY